MVFDEVQSELEAAGYSVRSFVLPAAGVNAPHRRERVFFVAHNASYPLPVRLQQCEDSGEVGDRQGQVCGTGGELADGIEADGKVSDAADTKQPGLQGQHREWEGCSEHRVDEGVFVGSENKFNAADADNTRLQGGEIFGGARSGGADGNKFASGCVPSDWEEFPTQSPVRFRDDGVPERLDGITFPKWRNESIKAAGNAIVPQVVHQIFKAIQEYENIENGRINR
jgi:DNA (cytosine-5)-methyltransferase 1